VWQPAGLSATERTLAHGAGILRDSLHSLLAPSGRAGVSLRILISVTHLLGAGHLTRAAAIGRALAEAGHEVSLVSGGMPAPLIDTGPVALIQLPPVRAAVGALSTLLDNEGRPVAPDRMALRIERLLEALATARPQVLVTELFPFGRRALGAEYRALLEAADRMRPRPAILGPCATSCMRRPSLNGSTTPIACSRSTTTACWFTATRT
jgi:predicted glycosyltransferase